MLSWAGQAVAVCDVRVDVVGAEDDKAITTAEDCRDYGLGANLAHWRIGELQECSQGQGCHSFEPQARRRLDLGYDSGLASGVCLGSALGSALSVVGAACGCSAGALAFWRSR